MPGAAGAPGAVVIGGYANGAGVVRALGTRGLRVAVVLTMPQDIAHRSRYASEHHRLTDIGGDPESLLELLERNGRRWRGWTLIPTNDHALEILARERDRLSASYRVPVPSWEVTRRVLDKALTRRAAIEVGIDVPRSYGPAATGNPLLRGAEYPVVVKPLQGHVFAERFGKKLLVARDRAELEGAVRAVEAAGLACEVLEVVPGPDDLHYTFETYRTAAGEFVGDFARRKLRQSPPFFGVSRAAEPAHVPELREPTYELLRRIEWTGFASAGYKRHPRTGRFHLMEVNGRCVLPHGLARRAGVDIPLMIYSEAVTGEPAGIRPNGWNGVWIHLHADILYTALYWRAESLDWKAFWRSYRRPKTFAVWSARDPGPFLAEWAHTLRKALHGRAERRRMLARVQPAEAAARAPAARSAASAPVRHGREA